MTFPVETSHFVPVDSKIIERDFAELMIFAADELTKAAERSGLAYTTQGYSEMHTNYLSKQGWIDGHIGHAAVRLLVQAHQSVRDAKGSPTHGYQSRATVRFTGIDVPFLDLVDRYRVPDTAFQIVVLEKLSAYREETNFFENKVSFHQDIGSLVTRIRQVQSACAVTRVPITLDNGFSEIVEAYRKARHFTQPEEALKELVLNGLSLSGSSDAVFKARETVLDQLIAPYLKPAARL